MAGINANDVIEQLWQQKDEGAEIYTLLDAAQDEKIYKLVSALPQDRYRCLYSEKDVKGLIEVAPYLVVLNRSESFIQTVIKEGLEQHWGIFLKAKVGLGELQEHFRKLLLVKVEGNTLKDLYFRFYDPRVLQVYLNQSNEAEKGFVFGPVICYWLADRVTGALNQYSRPDPLPLESKQQAISKSILDALERTIMMPQYEKTIIEYLRYQHPEIGEDLHTVVQNGTQRAKAYGATEPYAYGQFIELMLTFGENFIGDASYPWAAEITSRKDFQDGNQKVAALVDAAANYLDQQDSQHK